MPKNFPDTVPSTLELTSKLCQVAHVLPWFWDPSYLHVIGTLALLLDLVHRKSEDT